MLRKRFRNETHVKKYLKETTTRATYPSVDLTVGRVNATRHLLNETKNHWDLCSDVAQVFVKINHESVGRMLKEMGVEKKDGTIVTFAGSIGKFVRAIDKAGYKVHFSDIQKEWVDFAKKGKTVTPNGEIIPAKPLTAFQMDVKAPHIDDTKLSAIAAFEPTPIEEPWNAYELIAKNLGAKNGLILFTCPFGLFSGKLEYHASKLGEGLDEYDVEEKKADGDGILGAYQLRIPSRRKNKYLKDRDAYEMLERELNIKKAAKKLDTTEKDVQRRTKRFATVFKLCDPIDNALRSGLEHDNLSVSKLAKRFKISSAEVNARIEADRKRLGLDKVRY